jgi:hypothetical protein
MIGFLILPKSILECGMIASIKNQIDILRESLDFCWRGLPALLCQNSALKEQSKL